MGVETVWHLTFCKTSIPLFLVRAPPGTMRLLLGLERDRLPPMANRERRHFPPFGPDRRS